MLIPNAFKSRYKVGRETSNFSAFGGLKGIRDRGILDGCLKSAFSGFGNEEFFKTPMEKIAKITISLIRNHPFNDGNKRTGIAVMELLLNINGYKLKIDDDLLYKLVKTRN